MNHPQQQGRRLGLPALAILTMLSIATVAQAQLALDIKVEKKTYVSYEPMVAEVTVYNRSGRDVVLGGPGGSSWLRFQVKDSKDNLLAPAGRRIAEKPVLIKAGGREVRSVDLTNFYPVYDYGIYRVKASAYLPPLQRYYESAEVKVNVSDGHTIWEEIRGGIGRDGASNQRRFSLLTYRDTSSTLLYVRVSDEDTGSVYATYPLGSVILFHRPQAAIDNEGKMHALYLGAPQVFAHSIVSFEGNLLKRDVYRADGYSRPELMMVDGGAVRVRGGQLEGAAPSSTGEGGDAAAPTELRRLSDRPVIPGLGR